MQPDEEPCFPDVVSREGSQQRRERVRDIGSLPQHVVRRLGERDDNEVEIGVFVHLAGDERAPGRYPVEACVGLEHRERAFEEGAVPGRQLRPMPRVENVLRHLLNLEAQDRSVLHASDEPRRPGLRSLLGESPILQYPWHSKVLYLASLLKPGGFLILALMGFSTFFASVHQVPAGHIGVVYEFGGIKGQIGEGLQFVAPWRDVVLANIQVQRRVFDKLNAFSEESQDVFVRASLNVRVSPQTIQQLYRSVGPNFFNVLVESRVIQNFKDETVKYKSVEIAPNRENIRRAVRERLERELSPFSIEVVDLLLDNIDFSPEFKKAIEDKQIATQRALEEQQKIEGEKHKAQQAIERAKGEGSATLFRAEKEAEANRKLAASLTPELVRYAMVQKLSDKIQVMMLPSGQNFILDSDILRGTPREKR